MAQHGAHIWAWTSLGVCLVTSLAAEPAHACSWGPCAPGYVLPRNGGAIPANAPALVWQASLNPDGVTDGAVPNVRLVRLDVSSEQPTFRIVAQADGLNWLVLDQPLSVGGRYRLAVEGDCKTPSSEFEVTAAAELPTALGALTVGSIGPAVATVATTSGSCAAEVAAVRAETDVELGAAAQPWADLLMYETRVDGQTFRPRTSIATFNVVPDAEAVLFAECDRLYPSGMMRDRRAADEGLEEGAHDVVLEARLPGSEAKLATAAVSVSLRCPASGVVPGAGVPADGPARGGATSAGSDAGSDETVSTSGDDDEGEDTSATSDDAGCNVRWRERSTPSSQVWTSWSLLGLAFLGSRLLRRRG